MLKSSSTTGFPSACIFSRRSCCFPGRLSDEREAYSKSMPLSSPRVMRTTSELPARFRAILIWRSASSGDQGFSICGPMKPSNEEGNSFAICTPCANCTCESENFARIPSKTETVSSAFAVRLQGPFMSPLLLPSGPMTAMRLVVFASGRRPPSFRSRTAERAAAVLAAWRCLASISAWV